MSDETIDVREQQAFSFIRRIGEGVQDAIEQHEARYHRNQRGLSDETIAPSIDVDELLARPTVQPTEPRNEPDPVLGLIRRIGNGVEQAILDHEARYHRNQVATDTLENLPDHLGRAS